MTVNAFVSFGIVFVRDDDSVIGMKFVVVDYVFYWFYNDVVKCDEIVIKFFVIGFEFECELSSRGETFS